MTLQPSEYQIDDGEEQRRGSSPPVWSALSSPPRRSTTPTGTESAVGGTGSFPGGWSAPCLGSVRGQDAPSQHSDLKPALDALSRGELNGDREIKSGPEDTLKTKKKKSQQMIKSIKVCGEQAAFREGGYGITVLLGTIFFKKYTRCD